MSFRALWVVDVEHRVILFSRRFPANERRYAVSVHQQQQQQQQLNVAEAGLQRGAGPTTTPVESSSVSLASITGIPDEVLMESLFSYVLGSDAGANSGSACSSSDATALARMKNGPFVPPVELRVCRPGSASGGANTPRPGDSPFVSLVMSASGQQINSSASGAVLDDACQQVSEGGGAPLTAGATAAVPRVGPWIVSEATRGTVHVPVPPPSKADREGRERRRAGREDINSPNLSSRSLPSPTGSEPPSTDLLSFVYHTPEDVLLSESHPRFAYKQNLVLVALPLCGIPSELSRTQPLRSYLNDVGLRAAWDVVRASFHPLVDHMLIVAPPLSPLSATSGALRNHAAMILQPHGMIVVPSSSADAHRRSAGGAAFDSTQSPEFRSAPVSWVDGKVGGRVLHVVGGWSFRSTLRRVVAVFHWTQAMHLLVATALPFGSATLMLPRHTYRNVCGSAMHVRADKRIDASWRNLMSPAMEPEALFQSAESGDRKMRGSEMLVVDSLRVNRRTDYGGSGISSEMSLGSEAQDDDYAAAAKKRKNVLTRVGRLLRDAQHRSDEMVKKSSASAALAPEPTLGNVSCITVGLVCEYAAQLMTVGDNGVTTADGWSAADGDTSLSPPLLSHDDHVQCTYRIQACPPSSPSIHWLQRVDDLCEHSEEGLASVVLEDSCTLVAIVPLPNRSGPSVQAGPTASRSTTAQPERDSKEALLSSRPFVEIDETLISACETHTDVPVGMLAPIRALQAQFANVPGGGGKSGQHKGSSRKAASLSLGQLSDVVGDPIATVNGILSRASAVRELLSLSSTTAVDSEATAMSDGQPSSSGSPRAAYNGAQSVLQLDVLTMQVQGLHQWAAQRTSALARAEDVVHFPTDLCRIHRCISQEPAWLDSLRPGAATSCRSGLPVDGRYTLTPLSSPCAVLNALSQNFGWDERDRQRWLERGVSREEVVNAAKKAKSDPTDDDYEHRAWLEGLLETSGNVLYLLQLDVTIAPLPTSTSSVRSVQPADTTESKASATKKRREAAVLASATSSALSHVSVRHFSTAIRFLEDVGVVSLHVLHSHAVDPSGSRISVADPTLIGAAGDFSVTADTTIPSSASGGDNSRDSFFPKIGGSVLRQIAADALVWEPGLSSRVVPCGSRVSLCALVVLDLQSRSGAHELRCTLSSTNAHLSSMERRQLTTVVSGAEFDFTLEVFDPWVTGGCGLIDSAIVSQVCPSLSHALELRASVHKTELSSLHEAVQIGFEGAAHDPLSGEPPWPSSRERRAPIASSTLLRSSGTSSYVLWNRFGPPLGGT